MASDLAGMNFYQVCGSADLIIQDAQFEMCCLYQAYVSL
jgi:hypothetical protein